MSTDLELSWLTKSLAEMTLEEWESLCDSCARCCLYKVEYRDTGEVYYTNVACNLLHRLSLVAVPLTNKATRLVPHCLVLSTAKAPELQRLPTTCAYHRFWLWAWGWSGGILWCPVTPIPSTKRVFRYTAK